VVASLSYGAVLVLRSIRFRVGLVYFVLGATAWVGLLKAGVEPVVVGLALGVLPFAYPAERPSLERATERFREFREQPTAELARLSGGRLRPPVGWAAVAGGGTIAGIGFTVSLLIATLAFNGRELEEAKLGVLSAALGASTLTWLLFRAAELLPPYLRIRVL